MAYNIRNLSNIKVVGKTYFLDANIWLLILKPDISLSAKQNKYLKFFEDFSKNPLCPKIAVTTLLLSEIMNRYLRDVSFQRFLNQNPGVQTTSSTYKKTYRSSQNYKSDYLSLCDDFMAFSNVIIPVDDCFGKNIKIEDLLVEPSTGLDFNDLHFYQLAKAKNFPIITDDIDFFVEDAEIITLNNGLINKASSKIVPKVVLNSDTLMAVKLAEAISKQNK